MTDYVPELLARDARFADITISQLLDMTSGIHYEEFPLPNGDDALTYYFDDLRALAIERTQIDEAPGMRWHYDNYNPLLLGLVLERATGMPVAEYLGERLWTKIGTESAASWSLDREGGFEKMESGINARPSTSPSLGASTWKAGPGRMSRSSPTIGLTTRLSLEQTRHRPHTRASSNRTSGPSRMLATGGESRRPTAPTPIALPGTTGSSSSFPQMIS